MENWSKYVDAATRFIKVAESSIDTAPEVVAIIVHRAVGHLIMALAYKFDPVKAPSLNSHGRRRNWLARFIYEKECVPKRLLTIFDELHRIYKRSTYLLENGDLAREALELGKEALAIVEEVLGEHS